MPVSCDVQIRMMADAHRKINNAAKSGITKWAKDVLSLMKQYVPVRSGATRDSLSLRVRSRMPFIRVSWFTRSGHGGYLERGTRKMAPEPYMFPAWEQMQNQLPTYLSAEFAQIENMGDVPDELVEGVKYKAAKGVGILGGKEAAKKAKAKAKRG